MRESSSSSSLAVVEKDERRRRHGGCASVFFQLLDWKKKHFAKKLLPPVAAAKRALRKFGGHEKLPAAKHLQIPKEIGGGSPGVKKSEGRVVNGMRAPGLVARLMGLEAMPIAHIVNPTNDSEAKFGDVGNKSSNLERAKCRRISSRFPSQSGRYALQFGTASEQQRRLALLARGQRASSRRKKTRLMEVATKILEPGLLSRSREKFAIANVAAFSNDAGACDVPFLISSIPQEERLFSDFHVGSCINCGNLVQVVDLRSSGRLDSSIRPSSSSDTPDEGKLERSSLIMENGDSRAETSVCQAKLSSVHCRGRKNVASKFALMQNNLRQNQLPLASENCVSGSKEQRERHSMSQLMHRSENLSVPNVGPNDRTIMTHGERSLQKNVLKMKRRDLDKTNPAARGSNINCHNLSCQRSNGVFIKQKGCRKELTGSAQKVSGPINNCPRNQNRMRSESIREMESGKARRKQSSAIPPRLTSAVRHKATLTSSQIVVEKSKCHSKLNDFAGNATLLSKNENYVCTKTEEDASFAHLEDKFIDKSYFKMDNLLSEKDFTGLSSLLVRERVISGLSHRTFQSQKNVDRPRSLGSTKQDHGKAGNHYVYSATDDGYPSPISCLEASFSDTLKPNCGSGISCRFHTDNLSTNVGDKPSTDICYSDESKLEITKFSHPADAISCAKSLFEEILLFKSGRKTHSTVESCFREMIQTRRNALGSRGKCSSTYMIPEGENPISQLLLDCMIESLDSFYSCFSCIGGKSRFGCQILLSKKRLAKFIEDEIIRWHSMAGKSLAELIGQDLQHPKIDWLPLKLGGMELIEQIENDIFELLNHELVVELLPQLHEYICRDSRSLLDVHFI